MTLSAVRINGDGEFEHLHLSIADGELAALQAALDCARVDRLPLAPGLDMWIDDEGYQARERNLPATALVDVLLPMGAPQLYYGPVLVLGANEDTGDLADVPLDPDTLSRLRPTVH